MRVIPSTDIVYSLKDEVEEEVCTHSYKCPLRLARRECMLLRHSSGLWESASATAYCNKLQKNDRHPSYSLRVCACTHKHVCGNANAISLKLFEILARGPHTFRTDFFFLGIGSVWNQNSNGDGTPTSTAWWLRPQCGGLRLKLAFWGDIKSTPQGKNDIASFPRAYLVWQWCYWDHWSTFNIRSMLRCSDPVATRRALQNRTHPGTLGLFATRTQHGHSMSFCIKCQHWFVLKEIDSAEWGQCCNVNAKEFCPFSGTLPPCEMRFWSHNKPSLIHKEIDLRQAERKSILPHKHLIYILIRFAYSWEVCAYTLATLQINTRRKYKIKMKALSTFGALRVSLVLQLLSKPSRWKKRHRRLISAAFGQKPRKPFGTADDDCCEWQYLVHRRHQVYRTFFVQLPAPTIFG